MDPFTLFTFFFETPYAACSVELLGSWDNFTTPYRMERDPRRGPTNWSGCYRFNNIIYDGDLSQVCRRGGGLKMGGTYWYYYRVDSYAESYDPAQPLTTSCPLLPGQILNVLDVPIETESSMKSSAEAQIANLPPMIHTLEPNDKYVTPKPPVPLTPPPVPVHYNLEELYRNVDIGNRPASSESRCYSPRIVFDADEATTYIWEKRKDSHSARAKSLSSRGKSLRSASSLKKLRIKPGFLNLRGSRSPSPLTVEHKMRPESSDNDISRNEDLSWYDRRVTGRRRFSLVSPRKSRSSSYRPSTVPWADRAPSRSSLDTFDMIHAENRPETTHFLSASPVVPNKNYEMVDSAIYSPTETSAAEGPAPLHSELIGRCRSAPTEKSVQLPTWEAAMQRLYSWSSASSLEAEGETLSWPFSDPNALVSSNVAEDATSSRNGVCQQPEHGESSETRDDFSFSFHLDSASVVFDAQQAGTLLTPRPDMDSSSSPLREDSVLPQNHGDPGDAFYQLFPDLRRLQPGSHFSAWSESSVDCASIRELEEVEFPSFSTMPCCSSNVTTPADSTEQSLDTNLDAEGQASSRLKGGQASSDETLRAQKHSEVEQNDGQLLRSPSPDSEFHSAGIGSPDCFQGYSLPAEREAPGKMSLEPPSLLTGLVYPDSCSSATRVSFGGTSLMEELVGEFGFLGDAVS